MNALDASPTHRFSVDDVHRMLDVGVLREGAPVELIDGSLVVMSPQGNLHSYVVFEVATRLREVYGPLVVLEEKPIVLDPHSMPEPDVTLLRTSRRVLKDAHPTGLDCTLVVEVSVSSQPVDRAQAALYGRAGVPVYWIVDVNMRTVTVFSEPESGYATVRVFRDHEAVPLPQRDDTVDASRLLGEA